MYSLLLSGQSPQQARQLNPVNPIRTLTFDLDDTLWDNRAVLLTAEQTLYDWLDGNYPRIAERYSLEDLRHMRDDLVQQDPGLRNRISELRKRTLRTAARAVGYNEQLAETGFAVFLEARHRVTLYDDVIPALQRLRHAGFHLGSVTNGNADVHRLGIGHLFDFSLTAESVGRAKPHPRLFEEACRLADVPPAQLAHVGDEAATDLAGGLAAGVNVIWMNRLEQPATPRSATWPDCSPCWAWTGVKLLTPMRFRLTANAMDKDDSVRGCDDRQGSVTLQIRYQPRGLSTAIPGFAPRPRARPRRPHNPDQGGMRISEYAPPGDR